MTVLPNHLTQAPGAPAVARQTKKTWRWMFIALVVAAALGAALALARPSAAQGITNQQALAIISARYQGMADQRAAQDAAHFTQVLTILSWRYQGRYDLQRAYEKAQAWRALGVLSGRYQAQADSALSGYSPETVRALRILSQRYQAQAERYALVAASR